MSAGWTDTYNWFLPGNTSKSAAYPTATTVLNTTVDPTNRLDRGGQDEQLYRWARTVEQHGNLESTGRDPRNRAILQRLADAAAQLPGHPAT